MHFQYLLVVFTFLIKIEISKKLVEDWSLTLGGLGIQFLERGMDAFIFSLSGPVGAFEHLWSFEIVLLCCCAVVLFFVFFLFGIRVLLSSFLLASVSTHTRAHAHTCLNVP